MAVCNVCFRHCHPEEGETGFCGVRSCRNGKIVPDNYGKITSLALDPIEKKPLARFYPGSRILSVGSYGCNLRCPFCQNYSISWSEEALEDGKKADYLSPEELARIAQDCRDRGNIGIAFTYNEPLIGYEYILDTAKITHAAGMKNVLVTNGTASAEILENLAPYIDAMNIDLKGFTDDWYRRIGGNRKMTMDFIEAAVRSCHVELTTLIVPGENDSEEEMREMCAWIAGLRDAEGKTIGGGIPLHISRFFPRFHMTDRRATDVGRVYHLADIARESLQFVYTGNC